MSRASETSDIWWLSEARATQAWSVGLGHHTALADDYEPSPVLINENEPAIPGWLHSLDDSHDKSSDFKRYPLSFLVEWRSACQNTNVYRTLKLFPQRSDQQPVLGPFLVDIDNQDWNDGYSENLEDALETVKQTVDFVMSEWHLRESADLRLFFSGRKGFNLEVRPERVGIHGSLRQQLELSSEKLDELISNLRSWNSVAAAEPNVVSQHETRIDRIYGTRRFGYKLKHPYTRLHNSINRWISRREGVVARLRLQLTLDDLHTSSLAGIIARAETAS